MTGEITFRKFTEKDLVRISEFRKGHFSYNPSIRSYEPGYYGWKCYRDPILQGEMWLAEDGDTITGIRNFTPKKMKVLGTTVIGAEMGDSFTHPDYQGQGINYKLLLLARESMLNKGVSLIYGVPDHITALPGFMKKANHGIVPVKLRELVKPLKMNRLLEKRLHIPHPLAICLSPIINIISNVTTRIGAIGSTRGDISISKVSSFPDDIDAFWEQAAKKYDIMLVRNKDYLEWRYIENPDTYSMMLATNEAGATVGFIVTKIGAYDDVPAGFIVDFLTFEDNQVIFKKLLLAALKEFHREKVSIVFTWAIRGGFYDKILSRFGFLPFYKDVISCYQNELGNQILSHKYKWHFTMGDSDNI